MPSTLNKVARLKLHLERANHRFPVGYNLGDHHQMEAPFKVRLVLRCFENQVKNDEDEVAYDL